MAEQQGGIGEDMPVERGNPSPKAPLPKTDWMATQLRYAQSVVGALHEDPVAGDLEAAPVTGG